MKIVTWNVNGYRSITGQNPKKKYDKVIKKNFLFEYIDKTNPDIVCLQETKAAVEQINEDLRQPEGYHSNYYSSKKKKGYSGVATFSKEEPKEVNNELGEERFDVEGRFIETRFNDFILLNIYFPKGYADSERLDFKLDFYDYVMDYLSDLKKENENIIVSGDYNTAHKEIDLARPKQNENTSGFIPVERKKIDELISRGFVDIFRVFNKEGGAYTWWSQRGRAREKNVGWRIDYHFVSETMKKMIKNAYLEPEVYGSDHCPAVIEL